MHINLFCPLQSRPYWVEYYTTITKIDPILHTFFVGLSSVFEVLISVPLENFLLWPEINQNALFELVILALGTRKSHVGPSQARKDAWLMTFVVILAKNLTNFPIVKIAKHWKVWLNRNLLSTHCVIDGVKTLHYNWYSTVVPTYREKKCLEKFYACLLNDNFQVL